MPSPLPGSFASAAAGNNQNVSGRMSSRGETNTFGEWSRRPNGTQTFRRSSTNTTSLNQTHQRESSSNYSNNIPTPSTPYIPPHLNSNRSNSIDTRYSKAQLLDLFKLQKEKEDLEDSLHGLYIRESPTTSSNGQSKWEKRGDSRVDTTSSNTNACLDKTGSSEPLGLVELTDDEKEFFSSSVNSPLKAPNQSGVKEGTQKDGNVGRRISTSQGAGSALGFGLTSPTATRSSGRHREPSESYPFPRETVTSPGTANKSAREESTNPTSPFGLLRRRTDVQAGIQSEEKDSDDPHSAILWMGTSLGSVQQSVTSPSSGGFNDPSMSWSGGGKQDSIPSSSMGAFGNLGFGSGQPSATTTAKKPESGFMRESRFRGLMSRNIPEEEIPPTEELDGSSVRRLHEFSGLTNDSEMTQNQQVEENIHSHPRQSRYEPSEQERLGFSAFGPGLSSTRHFGSLDQQGLDFTQASGLSSSQPGKSESQLSMSPTFTNPYLSPPQHLPDSSTEYTDPSSLHLPGLGTLNNDMNQDPSLMSFGAHRELSRGMSFDARQHDRSQASHASANRGFPSLSGLGGLSGLQRSDPWSASLPVGTPGRERMPFADYTERGIRSPANIQSPGIPGTSTSNQFGAAGSGSFGGPGSFRGGSSRLGSLFPTNMQEQMRSDSSRFQRDEGVPITGSEIQEDVPRGINERGNTESPFQSVHGNFDDFLNAGGRIPPSNDAEQPYGTDQSISQFTSNLGNLPPQGGQRLSSVSNANNSTPTQPPAPQQKTMVMPDRIRWIYRDPQGNTQGPWSGLEMHEWYRAGFFSPELLIKKAEDPDYEPLAQLIRRIGNSREPFLVPQIGIPGPPNTQASSNWPSSNTVTSPSGPPSSAQPPFAGSFPSFGTTLTAEQQNALERRKQEEQYLMARQKEHLAQAQAARQLQSQHSMHIQQLQHHSSAQSLHSQPSYGSMTSPNGPQNSPPQSIGNTSQSVSNSLDNSFRLGGGIGVGPIGSTGSGVDQMSHLREENSTGVLGRPSVDQRLQGLQGMPSLAGRTQYSDIGSLDERNAQASADRARLEAEQADYDRLQQFDSNEDAFAGEDRLRQFQSLQANIEDDLDQENIQHTHERATQPFEDIPPHEARAVPVYSELDQLDDSLPEESQANQQQLSLTEQVQKAAASSSKSPGASVWNQAEPPLTSNEAPPISTSPLPAPAARRGRQNIADTLATESLAQSESPAGETPTTSVAPWAKESSDTAKQPSLKDIQEAEAKRAAKQEEIAAATRRAALERDLANQPAPQAPGLPSSSTWGSGESPTAGTSGAPSAWGKPTTASAKAVAPVTAPAKKTLQQIQQEEEALARKKKAASAANNQSIASAVAGAAQAISAGKRYADLAGKTNSPPAGSGAWTTVGAGGKAKAPPPSTAPTVTRTSSSTNVTNAANAVKSKPPGLSSRTSLATAQQTAQEEFKKWATAELRSDLQKEIHVDEFVQILLNLPPDTDMITEAVHQNSRTMDSRHFAEEFVRRRALAEKGKTDATTSSSHNQSNESKGGGWSEVARKGSTPGTQQKDESNAFKIVAAKKKGGKK